MKAEGTNLGLLNGSVARREHIELHTGAMQAAQGWQSIGKQAQAANRKTEVGSATEPCQAPHFAPSKAKARKQSGVERVKVALLAEQAKTQAA